MRDNYRARRAAWLEANDYETTRIMEGISRNGDEVSRLFDHGFVAVQLASGRRVLFGDPYSHALAIIPDAEREYGLTIHRHLGLWRPGNSTLLKVRVNEADKAWHLFADSDWGRAVLSFVGQPKAFLGMSCRAARVREKLRLRIEGRSAVESADAGDDI